VRNHSRERRWTFHDPVFWRSYLRSRVTYAARLLLLVGSVYTFGFLRGLIVYHDDQRVLPGSTSFDDNHHIQ
jgi:hypothetical protein